VSPLLFRSVVDFNVLSFDPILSDIHMPSTLNVCTNIGRVVSNSTAENIDFTNNTNIVITGNSESSVKLRWSAERAPVFVDSLSQDRNDELLDDISNMSHLLFDNNDIEVYFKLCLLLIFNSSKCLYYRTYKTEFGFEKYLVTVPYDLANVLCKFRCGSHRLPIECGRFFGIDRDECLCDLCDHSELGDEFHYLYNCTFFC
jgi:hypothetical protein